MIQQAWVVEKKNYHGKLDMGTPGEPTGHYLQMVWRHTKEVGCGIATSIYINNDILVCRYSPAGNTPDVSGLPATENAQQQSNNTGNAQQQQSNNAGSVPQSNRGLMLTGAMHVSLLHPTPWKIHSEGIVHELDPRYKYSL
jgi:hypothetical protein